MTTPKIIPYKLRAGEEGYFKPVEMSTLAIFAEITAFEHAYYFIGGRARGQAAPFGERT
jgi:hypothetical protein